MTQRLLFIISSRYVKLGGIGGLEAFQKLTRRWTRGFSRNAIKLRETVPEIKIAVD